MTFTASHPVFGPNRRNRWSLTSRVETGAFSSTFTTPSRLDAIVEFERFGEDPSFVRTNPRTGLLRAPNFTDAFSDRVPPVGRGGAAERASLYPGS